MLFDKTKPIVVATNNPHKLVEIRAILGDKFENLTSLKDMGIDVDVEETGKTLVENALIKARAINELTHMTCIADDTGLMVDALGGAPGVYSARYAGEEHDDKKNRMLLLKNLEGKSDRTAHFATCIAIKFENGEEMTAEGRVDGSILFEERGERGFGYDSLFFSNELQKTFAQASAEEKNAVSHRSRALKNMLLKLEELS